jgi:hypothetical protein
VSESKTSENRLNALERQRQALELRKAGMTYQGIADQLGYRSVSGAYDAIRNAMRATLQEPADELRALEAARLDDLWRGIWLDARKGNVAKIDRALKIMARRAALLGLDAPIKTEDVTDRRKEAEAIAAEIGKADDAAVVAQIEQDLLLSQEIKR